VTELRQGPNEEGVSQRGLVWVGTAQVGAHPRTLPGERSAGRHDARSRDLADASSAGGSYNAHKRLHSWQARRRNTVSG
jgi:hypothetical protein